MNVDDLPALADRFGLHGIPTLILLSPGKVLERIVGLRPYEELPRLLDRRVAVSAEN